MAICRLCAKDCTANNRLEERNFREKVVDIICMWIDINTDTRVDTCDACEELVERFYAFKSECRSVQLRLKNKPRIVRKDLKERCLPNSYSNKSKLKTKPDRPDSIEENAHPVSSSETDPEIDSPSRKPWFPLEEPELPPLPKPKKPKKVYRPKPKTTVEGPRTVVPRPWRRKFKEAIDMPPEQYREYVLQKSNAKKQTLVCEICGRNIDIIRMDGHKNRHLGLQPYECADCGDKFNCKLNLRGHWRRNHVVDEEAACETCGKVFKNKLQVKSHMKSHAERKFQCPLCPLKCSNKFTLNYHLKIHNQTRDFKCELCGKAFYCKSVWNIHMRTHSGEAPYKCDVEGCRKAFVHRNLYVAHMNKNHPGRPLMYLSGKKGYKDSMMKKAL
ncbi:zinc finger protein 37-like [Sabethes cyaneus]|uniref:zinc finger protein 37-like n=1 Tax=Sabethes cyaneus TaxID=53552 RepID=UPI00237E0C39|nr:zinc finger protein 37-like [Sabethes cyaneus]